LFLKQFLNYNAQSLANVVTGDKTWIHFYEPKRKHQNKIWDTKSGKRPTIAKCMPFSFFTTQGHTIQVAVPRGKPINAKVYKTKVFRKLKCF
jgi:hypothetical protein